MRSCSKWWPVLVMIAVDFAFATINILFKKLIDDGLNHLVFITYRLSVATIFSAPVAFFLERNSRPKLTFSILFNLFLNAILGASLTQYLFLLGIEYTSATFSCAFLNMVPVITFIMSLPFGLESINLRTSSGRAKVVSTLVCVGGATLLILYKGMPLFKHHHYSPQLTETTKSMTNSSTVEAMSRVSSASWSAATRKERWTFGSLALFAGTILWSSWFLLQSNIGKRYPCQYSSTAIMMFFGAIQSLVLSFSIYRDLSIWVLKGKLEFLSIIYAGMIGSGVCFVGMSWCVKKRGPVFTAAFSPLVQIIAAMFDVPFLHEQLHFGSLLGSVIVIAGLYILLWGKNKEMQNCSVTSVDQENEIVKVQEIEFHAVTVTCDSTHP